MYLLRRNEINIMKTYQIPTNLNINHLREEFKKNIESLKADNSDVKKIDRTRYTYKKSGQL